MRSPSQLRRLGPSGDDP